VCVKITTTWNLPKKKQAVKWQLSLRSLPQIIRTEVEEIIRRYSLRKIEFALIGVILAAFAGFLIGAAIGHPPASGLEILGAVIGAMVAGTVLILGEALKSKE
jgi:hypothetical protein